MEIKISILHYLSLANGNFQENMTAQKETKPLKGHIEKTHLK